MSPGQWEETYSVSAGDTGTSPEILKYRRLFEAVEECDALGGGTRPFTTVRLQPESYFEDEDGKPISMVDIYDRDMQRDGDTNAFAVVVDHPDSVLRRGPAEPIRPELWTQKDADLFARLFETYRFLARSKWVQSNCQVSPSKTGDATAILPVEEDCMSVILPFRQLYSSDEKDNLFNRACNLHNKHCEKGCPHWWWVDHYKHAFNKFLASAPGFCIKTDISARRYLDAFAYGARIVHATSRSNVPVADFEALLSHNSKEMVVFAYHYILHSLLGYVSQAQIVMLQNARHWTNTRGWKGPTDLAVGDVFGGAR